MSDYIVFNALQLPRDAVVLYKQLHDGKSCGPAPLLNRHVFNAKLFMHGVATGLDDAQFAALRELCDCICGTVPSGQPQLTRGSYLREVFCESTPSSSAPDTPCDPTVRVPLGAPLLTPSPGDTPVPCRPSASTVSPDDGGLRGGARSLGTTSPPGPCVPPNAMQRDAVHALCALARGPLACRQALLSEPGALPAMIDVAYDHPMRRDVQRDVVSALRALAESGDGGTLCKLCRVPGVLEFLRDMVGVP